MGYDEEQSVLDWVIPEFDDVADSIEDKQSKYFELICLESELLETIRGIELRNFEYEETKISAIKPFKKKLEQIKQLSRRIDDDLVLNKKSRIRPKALLPEALSRLLSEKPDLSLSDVSKEIQKARNQIYDFADCFEVEECNGVPTSNNFKFSYYEGEKLKVVSKDALGAALRRAKKEISDT
ncbi:hypothetical protein [Colwellia sp. MEBiC06753]